MTDNGGNGTGGSGGEGSTYENPGNPSSPRSATEEFGADKDAEVVAIHYHRNYSFLSLTREADPLMTQRSESLSWDLNQPGSNSFDLCWGKADDSYLEWAKASWGSDGTGTVDGDSGNRGPKSEVCGVYYYGDPQPYNVAALWPWPGEFCKQTRYRVVGNAAVGYSDQVIARNARTLYELRTGGKTRSKRENLFVLTSHATTVGNPFWPDIDFPPWGAMNGTDLPGTDVLLGSPGPLGNDEKLYTFLSDGEIHNVTPRDAENPYFRYDHPGLSKHVLVHQTQCTALTDPRPDRTQIGVGEYVNFYFDPEVQMTFPEEPWWLAFAGSVSESFGSWTVFTAPSNASTATVRVFVRDAQLDTVFTVKEPAGVDHAVVLRTVQWGGDRWGFAEAFLRVFIAPTDVSFNRVEIQEGEVNASGVWGRFTTAPYDDPENIDHDLGDFRAISRDNRWNPQPQQPLYEGDHIRTAMVEPYEAGGYTWPIPANWRIPGGATNPLNSWSPQVVMVGSNGLTRITKFVIWVQRTTNDVYTIGP